MQETPESAAKIALLEAENAMLRSQVSGMALIVAENVALKGRVLELEQMVRDLAKKVEQMSVRKTSENSSIPPSSDPNRKNRSLRPKSDLKPGGQTGHKGTTLKMTDTPDHIVPLVPSFCSVCASQLDSNAAILTERRQVLDIPPIHLEVTEYRAYEVVCSCGHHQRADFPQGVENHVQYGPNITSIAVYHNVYQYVAFKRLRDFFLHICHTPISIGTLETMVKRTADKARPIWEGFRQSLENTTGSVGSDETGAKVNGNKHWVWVWQTTFITFLVASSSRGADVIQQWFPKGFLFATMCSDRWGPQLKTIAKGRQLCLAHLLRDLEFLIQSEKTIWASQFKEILAQAIKLKQLNPVYSKNHPDTLLLEQKLDDLLLQEIPNQTAPKTFTMKKSMTKWRDALFPFLYDPLVSFDNNASERSIRNLKVKLKVSGQFKSAQEEYCILRSVIDTTIKNGQSVFEAIAAIIHLPSPPKAAV
jgi:transposase